MQKAFIQASFLSAVLGKETSVIQQENKLFLIREEGVTQSSSRLYQLFFEEKKANYKKRATSAEETSAEYDYYTSYE